MEENRLYRVSFDFTAEGEGELSVSEGQIVLVLPRGSLYEDGNDGDGWVQVQLADNADTVGFVPAEFLESVDDAGEQVRGDDSKSGEEGIESANVDREEAVAADGLRSAKSRNIDDDALHPEVNPFLESEVVADAGPFRADEGVKKGSKAEKEPPTEYTLREDDEDAGGRDNFQGWTPSRPSYLDSTPPQRRMAPVVGSPSSATHAALALTTTASASPSAVAAAMQSEEFSHIFASHDEWFKAAMAKRSETFRGLQRKVADLGQRLADADSKEETVVRQLADLEDIIAKERAKWSARLERERKAAEDALPALTN